MFKHIEQPVLLGAIKTTELNEGPSGVNADIKNLDKQATATTAAAATNPNDPDTNSPKEESFPRSTPYLIVPPSLLSNQPGTSNQSSAPNRNGSDSAIKNNDGKSIIVNLNLNGSSAQEKKRLSQILNEVQQMRQMRKRHNSFGTEGSFNEKMERTKENILRRLDKMKRSKQLLFKYRVYEFFKRPSTFWATIYHVVAFVLVMACLIVSIFPQVDLPHLEEWGGKWKVLDILEKIVVIWFTIEYLLRLWSCNCRPKYCGCHGKWNFIKAPAHLIDLFVIVLSVWVMVWPHEGHEVFAFRAFRGFHRFFQVVQIIITERQLRPWRLFLSVLYDQREQLMIIFYLEIIIFSLLAYLGFLVEHQGNDMLDSMAEAVWWSIVTLTTVGYGDKVPISWRGKIISATFILFGFCVFALPAGIIGAGLALKLEQVEQSRQRRHKVEAAARVIQRAWHCYHDSKSCQKLSSFFSHQPDDLYKARVLENISQAFISVVRFQVAKSQFKQLTRTVNLRNVIESYKYGQMDIFARLKQLNLTLDTIMTKIVKEEHERTEAIKRLTTHLPLQQSGLGDTLIPTREGSYLINTVRGCFNKKTEYYPDLIFLPRKVGYQDGSTKDLIRVRSMAENSLDQEAMIPYIDDWDSSSKPKVASQLRKRKSSKRRHSK